jgi:hypothetical protein
VLEGLSRERGLGLGRGEPKVVMTRVSEETAGEVRGSGHLPSSSGIDPPTLQSRLWVSVFFIVAASVLGHTLSSGLGIVAWFWALAGVSATLGALAAIVRPLAPPKGGRTTDAASLSVLAGGTGLALLFPGSGWGVVLALGGLTVACFVAGSSIHHLLKRRTAHRERT